MTEAWENTPKVPHEKKTILVAPSWQKDNIMDSCIDQLIEQFLRPGVRLIIPPPSPVCAAVRRENRGTPEPV